MLWRLSLMEKDGLGRKQSKKTIKQTISWSPQCQILDWWARSALVEHLVTPHFQWNPQLSACVWCLSLKERITHTQNYLLAAGMEKIFFVFLCPGQEGFWMLILGTHLFSLNGIGTAGNLFYGFIYTMLLWDGERWLICFTDRELKQREAKAQIWRDLKKPVTLQSLKDKTPTPQKKNKTKNKTSLSQYLIKTFQHPTWWLHQQTGLTKEGDESSLNHPKQPEKEETQKLRTNNPNSITFGITSAAAALPICQQHLQPQGRQWKVINFSLLINSPLNAVLQSMRFSGTQSLPQIRGYHLFLERYSQTSSLVLSWPTLEGISKIAYFSHNNWVSRQKK